MTNLRDHQGTVKNPDSPVMALLGQDAVAKILMALILRECKGNKEKSVTITTADLESLDEVVNKQGKANIVFVSNHDNLVVKLVDDTTAKGHIEHEAQKNKGPKQ